MQVLYFDVVPDFSYVAIMGIFLGYENTLGLDYFLAKKKKNREREVLFKSKEQNLCIFLHFKHSNFFFLTKVKI